MAPKVAGKGNSFRGAALYYLHDKGASTRERVAFAETVNLPTRDPDKAFKCMAWTALHQDEIKARAGSSRKGRKLVNPVYTYSLAWAPDEKPTQQEMVAAAMETLEALGLSGHEAVLVGHRDEPHAHIHVIVNRVHPGTGIAAGLSKDHLILSRWAESYEKRQGQIRCEQRVENNERRRRGEFVKDRRDYRAGDFYRWRTARVNAAPPGAPASVTGYLPRSASGATIFSRTMTGAAPPPSARRPAGTGGRSISASSASARSSTMSSTRRKSGSDNC